MNLAQIFYFTLCHITYILPFKHTPLRYRYNSEPIPHANMSIKMRKVWLITQIPWCMYVNIVQVIGTALHKTRTFPSTHKEFYKEQWNIHIFTFCGILQQCLLWNSLGQGPSITILQGMTASQTKGKAYHLRITLCILQVKNLYNIIFLSKGIDLIFFEKRKKS